VPHPTGLESGNVKFAFSFFIARYNITPRTINLRVATIIDFFKCLEACCQVTSKNGNLRVTVPQA